MDQSRPRHPSLKSPLIDRPDLQTRGQRTLYGTLTVGFWMFWIYLWVPLLALLAWMLGIQQANRYMVQLGGLHQIMHVFEDYTLVVAILGGTLLLWAGYNIYRFRGVDKRAARPSVSNDDIGRDIRLDPQAVARWQSAQRLAVIHDETGRLVRVNGLAG